MIHINRQSRFFIMAIVAFPLFVGFAGCKKYLDVNQNLNSPTQVPLPTLLTATENRISNNLAIGSTLGTGLGVYTHQLMQYGSYPRYGIDGGAMDGSWQSFYVAIANLDVIIDQSGKSGQTTYSGIAKILKAYTYSMMVDIWGDLPFSQTDDFAEARQPSFDKGSDIYPQLFTMLDDGIADLQAQDAGAKPGNDDIVYGGKSSLWIKAANTIKLKMYTQVRLVQNVSAEVKALLDNPSSLINNQSESFMFKYGPNGATDDRYPGYDDYNEAQRGGQLPSPWLWEIMKGYNPEIYSNVVDPRIPYYFYIQMADNGTPENHPDYQDGGFVSIIFGSNGPYVGGANSNTYTMLGIYPVGGRYDDGARHSISATASSGPYSGAQAGTGAAPQRCLTYADRLYLEAELINSGVYTGSQSEATVFEKAVRASFSQVDYIVQSFVKPTNQTVPAIVGTPETDAYITSVLNAYNGASSEDRKLEFIMTQKWLSRLGNSEDNYTDYRRTGYPLMFSPAPVGTVTSVTDPAGDVVPVSNSTKYPLSLPFSTTEIELNSNAPTQKNPATYKVFWEP